METIKVQVDSTGLERLDHFASQMKLSRSAAVRLLLNREFDGPTEEMTREEAIALISEKARTGHWQAMQYMADRPWEADPDAANPFAAFNGVN